MTGFEIPLTPRSQRFTTALKSGTYQFSIIWRNAAAMWFLDIADLHGNKIVSGIALVPGYDLLAPYAYLGFTGHLAVASAAGTVPTYDNLGSDTRLYYGIE